MSVCCRNLVCSLGGFVATFLVTAAVTAADVDFNRQVRPILADKCYACHGPDPLTREGGDPDAGGLHFDTQAGAFVDLGGYFAIVPGQPDESVMIERINSADPDLAMPPADHPKQLTAAEKQILRDWIQQGAAWDDHWAYVPPKRHATPATADETWPRNFIDAFVLERLEREGIAPSPSADKRTLLRRLSFDLVGLPPSWEDVQAFLADDSPEAYENAVDRLLKSPHYGERMAIHWLDLVRYADTVGYHGDQDVSISPYRDYVIDAFNQNMPFDQFTREQLAGDLLPNPTRDQLVASGYNKLGMMSAEGGVQPKEYLAKYAADRVRTASGVWMGSTLGCAECHEHKYDPFTSKDFYRLAAFFADIKERGLYSGANSDGNWGPTVEIPDPQLPELLEPIERELATVEKKFASASTSPELAAEQQAWEKEAKDAEGVPENIRKILQLAAAERDEPQQKAVSDYFRSVAPSLAELRKQIDDLKRRRDQVKKAHTRTSLITVSVPPRTMRVLPRGNWMDDSGDEVLPGVPHFLRQIRNEDRATRLDLANWFVARDNPLTARVFVNRLWKMYFGTGLSKVLDDVGAQGESPSHPELLDTLAVEFMESGWNVQHVVKLIVMSKTYQQSSMPRGDLRDRDPYNRLLARQSRFRLDAEMIRDNALAVSGLLIPTIGGRSVKPYQPEGLYQHLNFPRRTYQPDSGSNQYRRGVYTHWQRQFLHPAMKAFDAPPREECTAERPRSNTPLGALVLLNDPSYVEAARVFAADVIESGGESTDARLNWLMQQALSREPSDKETKLLTDLLTAHRQYYHEHAAEAAKIIAIGETPAAENIKAPELAAWTSVTRTVFNMHEFIARN